MGDDCRQKKKRIAYSPYDASPSRYNAILRLSLSRLCLLLLARGETIQRIVWRLLSSREVAMVCGQRVAMKKHWSAERS